MVLRRRRSMAIVANSPASNRLNNLSLGSRLRRANSLRGRWGSRERVLTEALAMRRLVIVHSGSAFLLFRWPGGDLLVSNREADLPEILQNSVDRGQQRNSEYLVPAAPTAPSSLGSMVMALLLSVAEISTIFYTAVQLAFDRDGRKSSGC
jgi:hypothetical protein